MDAVLLLLLDSRAPAGAHNHSGALEPAVQQGVVTDLDGVERFCRARLVTAGPVLAGAAARATRLWQAGAAPSVWAALDDEVQARTTSTAARVASRRLGSGLHRMARSMRPDADFGAAWRDCPRPAPHHPLVLGAVVAACGGSAELAARAAVVTLCSSATSAAVRLLGLDPLAAQSMLARLAPDCDRVAAEAVAALDAGEVLPASTSPWLELLADHHLTAEVRLFAS